MLLVYLNKSNKLKNIPRCTTFRFGYAYFLHVNFAGGTRWGGHMVLFDLHKSNNAGVTLFGRIPYLHTQFSLTFTLYYIEHMLSTK